MIETFDICVVGGGPAGMAAAVMAAESGLAVALLDERPSAGGQIYRGLEDGPFRKGTTLGPDYSTGSRLIANFRTANLEALFGASLWRVDMTEHGGIACYSKDGIAKRLGFKKLVLATGAMERPIAFEGWTLPGVMTIGAAQLLLKSSAVVPSGKIVLAGNGPLLMVFATQLIDLGVGISAILDTAPKVSGIAAALKKFNGFVRNRDKVGKGLRMQQKIRAARIPTYRNVSRIRAHGSECLSSVTLETNGTEQVIDADTLLFHEGIVPNAQLSRALGCRQIWDESQQCLRPDIDPFGESSIPGIFIVGDGAAINGAIAAPASAELAVGRILEQLDRASDSSRSTVKMAVRTMGCETVFRPFLDQLYPPRMSIASVSDDTVVCRCEEVNARALRAAIHDGAIGPAQAKAFTRCGMGPCQGRVCGMIVSRLIAEETGRSIADVGAYNVRFPLKPITVSEMATCGASDDLEENHHAA